MNTTITLYEWAHTVTAGTTEGRRWSIEQTSADPVPERTAAWVVFLDGESVGIGTMQWSDLEHGLGTDRLFWGTLRDGGACPHTTMVGHSLEECADRMVRRWLGLPLPEAVRS